MIKRLIAANWKMNKTSEEVKVFLNDLKSMTTPEDVDVLICPPFLYLGLLKEFRDEHNLGFYIGAQNCYNQKSGAFTGEVSANMLSSIPVDFVLIGHSERREYFKETNEVLLQKMHLALECDLKVVFCCGEPLDIRKSGKEKNYISGQMDAVFSKIDPKHMKNVVIAYEPIWAIGTGETALKDQVESMHAHIRQQVSCHFSDLIASRLQIIYGGSMKPANAKELLSLENVNGGLVGGASLIVESFEEIVNA